MSDIKKIAKRTLKALQKKSFGPKSSRFMYLIRSFSGEEKEIRDTFESLDPQKQRLLLTILEELNDGMLTRL